MMFTVSIIILSIILTPFIWWLFVLNKYKSLNKIPGPKPLPFVGNATQIGQNPVELLHNMKKFCQRYDGFFKFFIGPQAHVIFAKPELIEYILTSTVHITKSDGYHLTKSWLGEGLLLSTGNKWKIRRKIITPTFHFTILEKFTTVFNSAADLLVAKLKGEIKNESVDMKPYINVHSLDIICQTAMGVTIESSHKQINQVFVDAVRGFLDIMIVRFFSTWRRFDALFKFSSKYKEHIKYVDILQSFTSHVIETRRDEIDKCGSCKRTDNDSEDGRKERIALLDLLLQSDIDDDGIREEINTFLFEGHDTVASAICFTLYELARNPEIQKRVYEEMQSELGNNDVDPLTIQDLNKLKYLNMVIKEGLRLHPSVPLYERQLTEDVTICGIRYPKDTVISIFIYAMHHDPNLYPNPDRFDPDRFLPENVATRHNFAYVPFSAGLRNCIGQKFAILETKATLTKIVRNFQLLPVPGFVPIFGMSGILQSYNGVCIKLKQRSINSGN